MRTFREGATSFIRTLKQLNLFNTYSTDENRIRREIITTRIYLILLPILLTILIVYAAQQDLVYTIQVNHPTVDTYQQLIVTYPDTLLCPCSQLSLSYSSFITLTPQFHPVCSSDFIENLWLSHLYHADASFYLPFDIRSIGNAQFQLLRDLCQLSKEIIDGALKTVLISSVFVDSRGMLLRLKSFNDQAQAFVNDFTKNIASEQRRQQTLLSIIFDRNFLVSALGTASIPIINADLNLKMNITPYYSVFFSNSIGVTGFYCYCNSAYSCLTPLGITYDEFYDINYLELISQPLQSIIFSTTVNGFQAGCLPFNSLLLSTLECYNSESCLKNITNYFPSINESFHILNTSLLYQSTPKTLISTLSDQLMVEQWLTEMNYSQYFQSCRPISCSYTYVRKLNILYIFTTVIGLLGGLIQILRVVCPQMTVVFYQARDYIFLQQEEEQQQQQQQQSFKECIHQMLIQLKQKLITLNLYSNRNSSPSDIEQQIFTTRFYIVCLIVFTLILISITTFDQRATTTIVSMPTINEFEELYQNEKLPYSCPCSQIAIKHSNFLSLTATFHQICSSDLLSQDWFDRLSYTTNTRSVYYYLDIRSYGLDMFQTISSFCTLVNETTVDALTSFLETNFITTQVLSREQFTKQMEILINNFQIDLKNTFTQSFNIARQFHQANQVLSSRVSNFFFKGTFDNNSHLIDVQTYAGTVSSINDTLPTCSCVFNQCNQQLGFYETIDSSPGYSLIANIPGMYSACYPLNGVRMTTFECWFNKTCIQFILSNLAPFAVNLTFDPLDTGNLIRFSPDTTIGYILDNLMIELWTNITNYEMYYNICKPTTCSYTSYSRFNWFYTITILTSIFGGLTVSLKIICKVITNIFSKCQRKRHISTSNELTTVQVSVYRRIFQQTFNILSKINIFDSDSPHAHIQRRERLSTRLCIVFISSSVIILFIILLFVQHTRQVTIKLPSLSRVQQLKNQYPLTLTCPCTQTSMPYSTFLSLEVAEYHPICSSSLLSKDYLERLWGENLIIISNSIEFQRQFLAAELSLLNNLCVLIKQTVNNSITNFLDQKFVSVQILTKNQFYDRINTTIDQIYLDLSFSLRNTINYLQKLTHGNAIMSTYQSNWQFVPDTLIDSSIVRTKPISYGNCSCAISSQCSLPLTIENLTFPGLAIGCLPSTVLLQSTFECFYNEMCLTRFHNVFFGNITISSLPSSINISRYFPVNTPINAILDELFIERWFRQNSYETFFQTCQVSSCTYTYVVQPDIVYVVTTITGLIGGLTIISRILSPFFVLITISLINRIRKKTSIPVQIFVPSTQLAAIDTQISNKSKVIAKRNYSWRRNYRLKKLIILCVLFGIVAVVISLLTKKFASNFSTDRSPSSPITISAAQSTLDTTATTTPSASICSANAKWAKKAVTVAGFANGSSSTSLAGLNQPYDFFIDDIGNMYILDTINYRILYWPKNSTEGRIVIDTGVPDLAANQLNLPVSMTNGQDHIFVSYIRSEKIEMFQFPSLISSSNGTTILEQVINDNNRSMPIMVLGMTFDHKYGLLYLGDYFNQRLLVFNITEENIEIVTDDKLLIINSSIAINPVSIAIDELSEVYYVSDSLLNTVVKFKFGSTIGTIVAGNLISTSIFNQLHSPQGLTVDSSGYLYIVDTGYNRVVQLLNENGDLRTVAGIGFFGNTPTRFTYPTIVKCDQYHNLYVLDSGNNRIQRFDLFDNGCS